MERVRTRGTTTVESERPRLRALAYQMLGTVSEAEDAVQEAYARYYRLSEQEREEIRRPGAWLMRTTGRIALDELKSARARRTDYLGEWLPEPVPAESDYASGHQPDPADVVSTASMVSQALLILLESLSPAERAVYVLRESFLMAHGEISQTVGRSPAACRQLLISARKRLGQSGRQTVLPQQHDDTVRAFAAACESGDMTALAEVLDPSVTLRSDGGGKATAALHPIIGLEKVTRMLRGLREKHPEARLETHRAAGALALTMVMEDQTVGVMTCSVSPQGISEVWITRNPEKLSLW